MLLPAVVIVLLVAVVLCTALMLALCKIAARSDIRRMQIAETEHAHADELLPE